MKTMAETTSHRTAGEPPPGLQYRNGRHRSTTPNHATTWPQVCDDNHDRTCTRRRCSLQAKLARTSLRLMILRLGEPSSLYTP